MKNLLFVAVFLLAGVRLALGASLTTANVSAGAPIPVSWDGSTTARDWIGIYNAGAGDSNFQSWFYTNGVAAGSGSFAGRAAGTYDLRMFANDGWARIASTQVVVGSGSAPPPPPPPTDGCDPMSGLRVCFDGNTQLGIYPRGVLNDSVDNTAHSVHYECAKARGTRGAPLSVADGDYLCALYATAFDGLSYVPAGFMAWKADGWPTPGGTMGSSLVFAVRSHQGGMLEALTLRRVGNSASLEGQGIDLAASEIRLPRHAQGGNRFVCIDAAGKIFVSATLCN